MSKDKFRERLIPYLDCGLGDQEREELEEHLKECIQCRRELDTLRETLKLTRLDRVPEFSGVAWNTKPARISRWWRWIPLAAAAAFLVVFLTSDVNINRSVADDEEWMILSGDSISVEQGVELANMLLLEDEELIDGLEIYDETIPAGIYEEIEDLSDEEETALIDLLEEMNEGIGRS